MLVIVKAYVIDMLGYKSKMIEYHHLMQDFNCDPEGMGDS